MNYFPFYFVEHSPYKEMFQMNSYFFVMEYFWEIW
jgi:hypothetical protein